MIIKQAKEDTTPYNDQIFSMTEICIILEIIIIIILIIVFIQSKQQSAQQPNTQSTEQTRSNQQTNMQTTEQTQSSQQPINTPTDTIKVCLLMAKSLNNRIGITPQEQQIINESIKQHNLESKPQDLQLILMLSIAISSNNNTLEKLFDTLTMEEFCEIKKSLIKIYNTCEHIQLSTEIDINYINEIISKIYLFENRAIIEYNSKHIEININNTKHDVPELKLYVIKDNNYKLNWVSSLLQIIGCELEGHNKGRSKVIKILKQNNVNMPKLFFDLVEYGMNNIENFQNHLIKSFETVGYDSNTGGHHPITYYPGHKGRQFVYNTLWKNKKLWNTHKTNPLQKALKQSIEDQPSTYKSK